MVQDVGKGDREKLEFVHRHLIGKQARRTPVELQFAEAVRSISKDRLLSRWGTVNAETMEKVEDRMRMLLGL